MDVFDGKYGYLKWANRKPNTQREKRSEKNSDENKQYVNIGAIMYRDNDNTDIESECK